MIMLSKARQKDVDPLECGHVCVDKFWVSSPWNFV